MARRVLMPAVLALVLVIGVAGVIGLATSDDQGPVASLDELREQEVLFLDEHDIYLVYNDGDPLALSNDAQHVGDEVEFCRSSQMFESPAHGEKLDIRGYYYGGPARSGLDRYPVRVEGDDAYVDVDHPIGGPPRSAGHAREPEGPFCVF